MDYRFLFVISFFGRVITEDETVSGVGCQHTLGGDHSLYNLKENSPTGFTLFSITNISNLVFISGNDDTHFKIHNESSHWTITLKTPLDYETNKMHTFNVSCTDSDGKGPFTYRVVVVVLNVFEGNIILVPSKTNFNFTKNGSHIVIDVPEHTPKATDILKIEGQIADAGNIYIIWKLSDNSTLKVNSKNTKTVLLTLDRDLKYKAKNNTLNITVRAEVEGHEGVQQTMEITISVKDVDDKNPKFEYILYKAHVQENATTNTLIQFYNGVKEIKAKDQDVGINAEINYSLVQLQDFADKAFKIDNQSGVISVATSSSLSRGNVTLIVKAYQVNNPEFRQDVAVVRVDITDVNDNSPIMSKTHYSAKIPENMGNGQSVIQIEASDADQGVNAKFIFVLGNCTDAFEIDNQTGTVHVKNSAQLDVEKKEAFFCQVYAEENETAESRRSETSKLNIKLTDVNDNSPEFVLEPYSFNVTTTPSNDTVIGQMNATDDDISKSSNGKVTYRISSQEESLFRIDKTTGKLRPLYKQLYSCNRSILPRTVGLDVTASDNPSGNSEDRSTTVRVVVSLKTNLCPPQISFQGQNYTNTTVQYRPDIKEDLSVGSIILIFEVLDVDPVDTTSLSLTDDTGHFQLNTSTSGEGVVVLKKKLDRETQDRYNFTVRANDEKHVTYLTFHVIVGDVNDNAPVFNQSSYNMTVAEESNKGQIGVKATDGDLKNTNNSKIIYKLMTSKWSNHFQIDTEGIVNLTQKIDREEMAQGSDTLDLIVIAEDGGTPPLNGTAVVTVTVQDINDHAPQFDGDNSIFNLTFNETEKPVQFYTAKATDEDSLDDVCYRLLNGTEVFSIDTDTGKMSANINLTRSDAGIYVIEAYNNRSYSDNTIRNPTQNIKINIKDINDHCPEFNNQTYHDTFEEDAPVGSELGSVTADDADWSEEFGSVYYWITDGNSEGHFYINELNGSLYLASPVDYETKQRYNLTITASDTRNLTKRQHIATTQFVLDVKDVNDNKPEFSLDYYQCNVTENKTGPFNCCVKAVDNDLTETFNQTVYKLQKPSYNFTIDNKTGEITVAQPIDFDIGSHSFNLIVQAFDGNNSTLKSACHVIVSVLDINDESPVFQQRRYTFSVAENQQEVTEVGVVKADDKDSKELTYTIDGNSDFNVNESSGIITTQMVFDYENRTQHQFNVTVSDGKNSDTASITVDITDMNDHAPVFSENRYTVQIAENISTRRIFNNISASDADHDQTVTYSLMEDYGGLFSIDSTTGILSVNNEDQLDYEKTRFYILELVATDNGQPALNGTSIMEVVLTDVDDTCPVFNKTTYTGVVIKENQTYDNIIQDLATDVDTSPENLVYKVINNSNFDFNGDKLRLLRELDVDGPGEPRVINLIVSVTDNSTRDCNATSIIQIQVENVNDNVPMIDTRSCPNTITQYFNGTLCTVIATDADLDSNNFTFFLTRSYGIFTIDQSTGNISVPGFQTLKANITYNVSVVVSDHGGPPQMNDSVITIFVNASNHFRPEFINSSVTVSIDENVYPKSVFNMTATDGDSGREGDIKYQIIKGDNSLFEINDTTGEISLKKTLKCNHPNTHYILTVKAQDQGFSPMSTTGDVTIIVTNVNEKPEIQNISYTICVNPPLKADTPIAEVIAKDPDFACTENKSDKSLTYNLTDPSGLFQIRDKNIGVISTAKNITNGTLDYTLSVTVTDFYGLSATKNYIISSGKKGEPVFQSAVTDFRIKETRQPNTTIYTIKATGNGSITYTIKSISVPSLKDAFSINKSTGAITLLRKLDRENLKENIILLVVNASNHIGTCNSQVFIHIEDENDEFPSFINAPYHAKIKENETADCLLRISASDPDIKGELQLEIVDFGTWSDTFSLTNINNDTAKKITACIHVKKPLDAEVDSSLIELQVNVTDGQHVNSTYVYVTVIDINDNYPNFTQSSYNLSVSEDTRPGKSFGTISATDEDQMDKEKLKYSIDEGVPFEINHHSGVLTVKHTLDREENSSYVFNVYVEDSSPDHKVPVEVNVRVLDVNDNPPHFDDINATKVNEGEDSKNLSIDVTVTDPDLDENGTVTFTLANHEDLFGINKTSRHTGTIFVRTELDHEAKGVLINEYGLAEYSLQVVATDQGNPSLSSTGTVDVFVEDINDCTPQFEVMDMQAVVMEGSSKGFSVYRVTATDCDYDPQNKNLTFDISGVDEEYFSIHKEVHGSIQDGIVKLTEQISIDDKEVYIVNVTVTDGKNTNTTSLTISVEDVNDHDPNFTLPMYQFTTPENDGANSSNIINVEVGQVTATDKDQYKNGNLSYSIVTSDVQHLFNVTQDGWIHLIDEVDRDQCASHRYSFTVIAVDAGSAKRTGFTEVVVDITDLNDNFPVFQPDNANYIGTVKENSPDDTTVLFNPPISATDDDNSTNGTGGIRYFIVSSDALELPFRIDNKTGNILVNDSANLDRETKAMYKLQVEARDSLGGAGCQTNSTEVIISVLDENDNSPIFTSPLYNFSIPEDAQYGEVVGSVTADDRDLDFVPIYYIKTGAEGYFSITDQTSGNISVTKELERERKSNYSIIVGVSDGKNTANATVLISLEDVNEPPTFNVTVLKVSVAEGKTFSHSILNLSATDNDEGNNAVLEYILDSSSLDSNISTLFNLSKDGHLFLTKTLDREEKDSYSLTVLAVDNGSTRLTATTTVHVTVTDINDHSPVFYDHDNNIIHKYSASVLEMSPVNSIIYLPSCRDQDVGINGTAGIHYLLESQISGVNSNLLTIDASSGFVSIESPISFNILMHDTNGTDQTLVLPYVISATDGGTPPSTTNLTLYLTVENINDNAPVFSKPRYDFSIRENASENTRVDEIKAEVVNETYYHLTYSMIKHAEAASNFSVHADGQIFTKGVLDRETKSHVTFAAQVVDGRVPERTAFTVVSITLLDVNDNSPVFDEPEYHYSVTENDESPPPLSVSASDKDEAENARIKYSLTENIDGKLILNETTGKLSLNGSLDREITPYYRLQIQALDNGNPQRSSTVNITVRVGDVNDNAPAFTYTQRTVNISENLPGMQNVAMVTAEDPDDGLNGTVVYELEQDFDLFRIDSLNGTVYCVRSLDYEKQTTYNLTVTARDLGTPPQASVINLTVSVIDVADDMPKFSQVLYEVTASIADGVGRSVLNVTASGRVIYTITDGNHEKRFAVNQKTGELRVRRSLAHGQAEYLFTVEARDTGSNFTARTKVLVRVPDLNTAGPSVPHYTAELSENKDGTSILFNLTSHDKYGAGLEYVIIQTEPSWTMGYFYISGGAVFCNQSLDRENTSSITLRIGSTEKQSQLGRKKRSTDTGEIILVVNVTDVNDNSPSFTKVSSEPLVFGVPIGAQPGDVVGVVKAYDPDSLSAGKLRYNITGGDLGKFYVYPISGQIVVRQVVYQDHSDNYTLTVTATDEGGRNGTAQVTVLVVPSSSSMILIVPITNEEVTSSKQNVVQKLSKLLGFKFEFEKSTPHTDDNLIDPCRTDILFHCINLTTNSVVPKTIVQEIIQAKNQQMTSLFCQAFNGSSPCQHCADVTVQRVPVKRSSKISTAEIALLVIGSLILVGAAAALAILLRSPKRDQEEEKKAQSNVGMMELESMASSSLSKATGTALGVTNPTFNQQEVTQTSPAVEAETLTDAAEPTTRKRTASYESQEVILDFQENDNDFGNQQISHSNADSGVENESDSSRSGSIQTENDMEASAATPIGGSTGAKIDVIGDVCQTDSSENGRQSIFIAMETGDTTDDDISSTVSEGERMSNNTASDLEEDELGGGNTDMAERLSKTGSLEDEATSDLNKPPAGTKSVTFKPGPPVVEEYEAEEDMMTAL